MSRQSYLLRRGAVYYARVRVPLDLIDNIGKRELIRSLGTKDQVVAKRLVLDVVREWHELFDEHRTRRDFEDDDRRRAVWQHHVETLGQDEDRRRRMPTEADIDAALEDAVALVQRENLDVTDPLQALYAGLEHQLAMQARKLESKTRMAKLKDLRKHLGQGVTVLVDHVIEGYLRENNLRLDPSSDTYSNLARALMRAEIDALERTFERDLGNYSGTPRDPIVVPADLTKAETAQPGETLMELFENYARENPRSVKRDTLDQGRRDLFTLVDLIGRRFPVAKLGKREIREWKALLLRLPVKATESKAFAGMTLQQIVKANAKVGKPIITPRTVNRYINNVSAFCTWLVNNGWLETNPCRDMLLTVSKRTKRDTFTTDQLNTLFRLPLFTGCLRDARISDLSKPGNVLIRDYRFWVPLIMLFSGARPGEVAQLAVSDLRQQHGRWVMHITDEGDGDKSVKTEGSIRVVPVHSELIKLGLIKHTVRQTSAGHKALFPTATRNSRGQMIAEYSRQFPRYLEQNGLRQDGNASLYSFRHGAADALRRAGYLDEQFGYVLGHTKATMTARYGNLPQGMLKQRVELIEAIAYPGLDIRHLHAI